MPKDYFVMKGKIIKVQPGESAYADDMVYVHGKILRKERDIPTAAEAEEEEYEPEEEEPEEEPEASLEPSDEEGFFNATRRRIKRYKRGKRINSKLKYKVKKNKSKSKLKSKVKYKIKKSNLAIWPKRIQKLKRKKKKKAKGRRITWW